MNGDAETSELGWVAEVLGFWFDVVGPKGWFRKDEALDSLLRKRFQPIHDQVTKLAAAEVIGTTERALASLVVLDQFSRNMFRDTPQAFASDEQARSIARAAIAAGLDRSLAPERRIFLYLPFEHSEDKADQERSVALITALGDTEQTDYARRHKAIIDRFGRFPHRNAVLGRDSTPEELAFLEEPGSAF